MPKEILGLEVATKTRKSVSRAQLGKNQTKCDPDLMKSLHIDSKAKTNEKSSNDHLAKKGLENGMTQG